MDEKNAITNKEISLVIKSKERQVGGAGVKRRRQKRCEDGLDKISRERLRVLLLGYL